MNAIQRLRDTLDEYHGYVASDPTEPDKPAYDSLAAVDDLYQAAKEPTREYECAHGHRWVMKDGNAKQCPGCGTITFMLVLPRSDDALAAAVRRIEGTP